jgi:hypothetical protein
LSSLLAAKTEFKTIASKIIQHPAVRIAKITLRLRVITSGGPAYQRVRRPLIVRVRMACGARRGQSRMTSKTIEFRAPPATKLAR